ncbi:MAG: alpha/beta hydrolase [Cellvibrio sp.]
MFRPIRSLSFALALSAFSVVATAQDGKMTPLDAPAEPNAIALNTGGVANQPASESWFLQWGDPMARNITQATLTPFIADSSIATGVSVLVAPGGGFMWLSMGNEGWEVAEALNKKGINAFVLKYRLQPTADKLEDFEQQMNQRFAEAAKVSKDEHKPLARPNWDLSNQLADVEAAYALIERNAKEWNVDTKRLGMMGFSAGAGLTMATTMNSKKFRPAFIAPIYGSLQAVEPPKDAPPMFIAIATDDFLFNGDTGLVKSWFDAKAPVELHLYQNGGHGFGLGNPDRTSNQWFDSFIHWVEVNRF